ncbi:hypothetical protein GCM10023219_04370 [Stakelama sediminis]|uniref:Chemotaxis protein CheA n=1 Tax=Stakelama sediminis TaxID=463200 RepID=A0A840YU38_9SPHN|nr:chemotaxis protein CheW [Stakelama sediminis]MBB5717151.1 two-component system chemotaxis sensor kinase CheA [Stakelama sediminis]
MDDLLQEFIAETRETLDALSGEIVAWEAAPQDRERLDAIFRFVHTVKGSCGFLDLPRLARLSHAAEDVLSDVRSGKRTPDQALVNAVLAVVDRIGELVEAIDAGNSLDDSSEDRLIAALEEGSSEIAQPVSPTLRAGGRSVRLHVDLLDRMMSGMSDMVLARNELTRRLRDREIDPGLEAALDRLTNTVADMRDAVTRTRMQKVDALFSALPRLVRDTAAGLGKSVSLAIEGADVELDREMIEAMRDPLLHLVRNAIDHGIEAVDSRRSAGKSEKGRLTVSARQSGNQIVIEIADDGRGIDTDKLIRKLVSTGAYDEKRLRSLSDRAKLDLIFEPGLSTKDEVTEISGRGVGMDVVRDSVAQIGGRIELDNSPGKGLRISVFVPLTLSILSTVVVGAGDQTFAIPRQAIEEIVSARAQNIRVDRLGSAMVATVRNRKFPLVSLSALLGLKSEVAITQAMLVIVNMGINQYTIAVDAVLDNEELVVKPAAPAVMAAGVYGGQTLPDSGLPMLLLDCTGIAAVAGLRFGMGGLLAQEEVAEENSTERSASIPILFFRDLDGVRRGVPMDVVDRIEKVDARQLAYSSGRLRATIEGRMVPVAALGDIQGHERFDLIRLNGDGTSVAYAVEQAFDIASVSEEVIPNQDSGPIAGVILYEGEQVELIDPAWVYQEHHDAPSSDTMAPLCLVQGNEDGWMRNFIRPLLERSGYRVVAELPKGRRPAIILTEEEIDSATPYPDTPVVRLSARQGNSGNRIYRYDRTALMNALSAQMNGDAA